MILTLKRVSEDSLEEGASSSNSLEAPVTNAGGTVNRIKVPMLPPVLTKEEI